MSDREFDGVWFPADLYLSKEVSFQEKAFLIEIKNLGRKEPERGCWSQNRHFADQFDLSISRVSEVISSLQERGYVSINLQKSGRQVTERNIFLTEKALAFWTGITPSEKAKSPFGKHEDPPSEKAKENNTKVNNTTEDSGVREPELFGKLPDDRKNETEQEQFEICWKAYPHVKGRSSKKDSLKAFRSLPDKTRSTFIQAIKGFVGSLADRDREFVPAMERWIRSGKFQDFLSPESPTKSKAEERETAVSIYVSRGCMGWDVGRDGLPPTDAEVEVAKRNQEARRQAKLSQQQFQNGTMQ